MPAELSPCCNQVHTVDSEFCMSGNDPSTIKGKQDILVEDHRDDAQR